MKTRMAIMLTLVAFLLLSGLALAQSGGLGAIPVYSVDAGTGTGDNYRMTNLAWHVSGAAGGGTYRLTGFDEEATSAVSGGGSYLLSRTPEALTFAGSGCCCTYLPCVPRQYP
jgi:hypothetical protein